MAFIPSHHQMLSPQGVLETPSYSYYDHGEYADYTANVTDTARFSETADRGQWLVTVIDGGGDNGETITVRDDQPGGVIRILGNDADNDGMNLQLNGEAFKIAANKNIYWHMRMALSDADKMDWVVGLCSTDTTVVAGVANGVGFRSGTASAIADSGVANIVAFVGDAMAGDWTDTAQQSAQDTGVDAEDDTMVDLGFAVLGTSRVKFFVNGVQKFETTSNIPTGDALTLTMAFLNNEAAANSLDYDLIHAIQEL